MLTKIRIISRNASNKSHWTLNFVQENQWAHISTSLRSVAGRFRRFQSLKYYNVLIWESRFSLWLGAAESTHYIKKYFKWKLSIEFCTKNQWAHMSISPTNEARWLQRLSSSKYNVLKWESRFTLGLDAAKNIHYIKKCFK